ncbi:MAG: hypothetical protein OXC46_10150 [Thaumarchaeota archaeon]|nr:hypothetical protein [Nitrososphaerota archaeon]
MDGQKMSKFTIPITPNIAKEATYYYTSKPILKLLKNPEYFKIITHDGYV